LDFGKIVPISFANGLATGVSTGVSKSTPDVEASRPARSSRRRSGAVFAKSDDVIVPTNKATEPNTATRATTKSRCMSVLNPR
jgi:hypothetical protein